MMIGLNELWNEIAGIKNNDEQEKKHEKWEANEVEYYFVKA